MSSYREHASHGLKPGCTDWSNSDQLLWNQNILTFPAQVAPAQGFLSLRCGTGGTRGLVMSARSDRKQAAVPQSKRLLLLFFWRWQRVQKAKFEWKSSSHLSSSFNRYELLMLCCCEQPQSLSHLEKMLPKISHLISAAPMKCFWLRERFVVTEKSHRSASVKNN